MLEKDVFKAFKAVVGERFISQDPAVMDSYAFQWCNEIESAQRGEEPQRFGVRPLAVVLPESTEQVQAIVKLCNEHKVGYKAFSTGMGPWAGLSNPRAIQIDLRRMNRILEVDEKNMYAVIEPYVINSQLQSRSWIYFTIYWL
jgi:glycolate oxidase